MNDNTNLTGSFQEAKLINIKDFESPEGSHCFFYKTKKDINLRICVWNKQAAKGTIILQSGRTEFIEKYFEVVQEFLNKGYCVAMMDWRGQGLSQRLSKNARIGHVNDFKEYDSDLTEVIQNVYSESCPKPWIGFGHSMGGCLMGSYAKVQKTELAGLILCAPMFSLKMPRLFRWITSVLGTLTRFGFRDKPLRKPEWSIEQGWLEEPFSKNAVTSDEFRYERSLELIRTNEDLAVGGISIGWAHEAIKRTNLIAKKGWSSTIDLPILLLNATKDKLVNPQENVRICSELKNCKIVNIQSEHEILMESDHIREKAWKAIDSFMEKTLQ